MLGCYCEKGNSNLNGTGERIQGAPYGGALVRHSATVSCSLRGDAETAQLRPD